MGMALIEWRENFRIGIASVDHEHRELIGLLNLLYEVLQVDGEHDRVIEFLGEVHALISAHFALEERVMRERGYDQFAEHKAAHEDLLEEIREIMDSYESGAYEHAIETLSKRLEAWFTVHFKTHDARLHKMLPGVDFS